MQSNPTENRHKGPTLDESSIQSKDNSNKLSAIWALNTYNSQIGISSLSTSVAHYIPVNYHATPLSFAIMAVKATCLIYFLPQYCLSNTSNWA